MKFNKKDPPREFVVGNEGHIRISDCGSIELEPDEQVTFTTSSGAEYDVARKSWGFYATPSLNGRLASFGLRAVLTRNVESDRYFVMLVEAGKEELFEQYLSEEHMVVTSWMDTDNSLRCLNDEREA